MDNQEWHWYDVPFWRRPILLDGSRASVADEIMRRKLPDGSWQYRAMTDQERGDKQSAEAW